MEKARSRTDLDRAFVYDWLTLRGTSRRPRGSEAEGVAVVVSSPAGAGHLDGGRTRARREDRRGGRSLAQRVRIRSRARHHVPIGGTIEHEAPGDIDVELAVLAKGRLLVGELEAERDLARHIDGTGVRELARVVDEHDAHLAPSPGEGDRVGQ